MMMITEQIDMLETLNGIRDALYHFAGNSNDYSVVHNSKREFVILSNTANYDENRNNLELVKLMGYLQKFNISFVDYMVIDAIALSQDNILKLWALLRIEGY